ncbi:MAG: tetratricopeptide repeat protein, partial [Polyangiaceae bacterium]
MRRPLNPAVIILLATLGGCAGGRTTAPKGAAAAPLPPANPVAVAKMVQGVQAAKDGQRDRAVALLKAAVEIDPSLWEARYDVGALLAGGGDLATAEEQLALAAKLAPTSQEVAVALAEVRRRRGEQRRAADGLATFVASHPDDVDVRTLYVAVLRDSGQIDEAIGEARQVLVRKPADA